MRTTITIFQDGVDVDTEHLQAALKLAARHVHAADRIDVYTSNREPSGWLEYIVVMRYVAGGSLTVGVIQRTPGAEVECHS